MNPTERATAEGLPYIVRLWMFAPWPDAKSDGVMEVGIQDRTFTAHGA